jgi:hypothetical protein
MPTIAAGASAEMGTIPTQPGKKNKRAKTAATPAKNLIFFMAVNPPWSQAITTWLTGQAHKICFKILFTKCQIYAYIKVFPLDKIFKNDKFGLVEVLFTKCLDLPSRRNLAVKQKERWL